MTEPFGRSISAGWRGLGQRTAKRARETSGHQRRFLHGLGLLLQHINLTFPVITAAKPWEVDRKDRVVPALRQPSAVMNQPQRAQWLDECEFPAVKFAKFFRSVQQHAQLLRALRQDAFLAKFGAAMVTTPLVGRLVRNYNAARFVGTLAMQSSSGVPILKAVQVAAETLSNRAVRVDALDAAVVVREGAPLASALAQKKRSLELVRIHGTGHNFGAAADCGHGLGRDADRAGCVVADYSAEPVCEVTPVTKTCS